MRQALAIGLLLLYLTTLYKVAVPYIGFFANQEVIAAELCINQDKPEMKCNGKCYLMQKLKDLSSSQDHSNPLVPVKLSAEDLSSVHLATDEEVYEAVDPQALFPFTRVEQRIPQSLVLSPPSPPPQS